MEFIVNVKKGPHGSLVIVTDKELLGHCFSENKKQLDFTKEFYAGKEESKSNIKELILHARYLHLSGEKAVQFGIELNLIDPNRILRVKNIPHAEVLLE